MVMKTTKFLIVCIAVFCMIACAPTCKENYTTPTYKENYTTPTCKESYMEMFSTFITYVSRNHKTFSDKEWERKTEQFEKFSGEWHNKFRHEFTRQDRRVIFEKRMAWRFYRNYDAFNEIIRWAPSFFGLFF